MAQRLSDLADDALFEIFSHLALKHLASSARVCKRFSQLARDEQLWKNLCRRDCGFGLENTTPDLVNSSFWRDLYQDLTSWRWSNEPTLKSPDVVLSENDRVAQRMTSEMSHGVLAHRILQGFQRFEIEVLKREYYIQLGVCHIPSDLRTCTLGTKEAWVYFCETSSSIHLHERKGYSPSSGGTIMPIVAGDKIGFAVDVDKREMTFYHNGTRVYHCTEVGLPGKDLYPCAFLGGDNVVVRIQPPSFKYEL